MDTSPCTEKKTHEKVRKEKCAPSGNAGLRFVIASRRPPGRLLPSNRVPALLAAAFRCIASVSPPCTAADLMRSARSQRAAATGVLERVIKIQIAAAEALRTLLAVVVHQRCAVANAAYEA
jgi:hypothetical protein